MNKASLIFWCDAALFGLLLIVVLMIVPEVASHAYVHVIPGLLVMLGAGAHLWLHRSWVAVAFKNFKKMAHPAQENAMIDLGLLGAYALCGGIGLFARLMYYISPHQHFHLGIVHVLLAGLLLAIQTVHLARHFRYIKKNIRARIFGTILQET